MKVLLILLAMWGCDDTKYDSQDQPAKSATVSSNSVDAPVIPDYKIKKSAKANEMPAKPSLENKPMDEKTIPEKVAKSKGDQRIKEIVESESPEMKELPNSPVSVDAKELKTKEDSNDSMPAIAKTSSPDIKPAVEKVFVADHSSWDALLKKYVTSSGKVNYNGFKSASADLDAYLAYLDANPIQANWSRNEKMAYWINAYNAFTIKLIVDNHPVASITSLHGGKPWDVKWIELGGETYSLNQIENDILRPQYKDARIHFAVNCAAKSCPPILNKAWTADNLNANLDIQAKKFINDSSFNQIGSDGIKVSKIFEWYADDFGNLIEYLNKYAETKIDPSANVSYIDYDWALNN